jgi:hypothetical protein
VSRRNGCKGKVKHASREAAIIAMKRIRNAGLNSYKCPRCGGWHLGTSNKPWRIIARIDQLLKE